jgi:hypothetical protein
MSRRFCLIWLSVCLLAPSLALAQAPTGRVRVTVADPSGAVIPNASVAVRPQGASPESTPLATLATNDTGVAVQGIGCGWG